MRVLAVYSIKGGVGKTASAVNLAHAAARSGLQTLLLDLDPQGAASFYFRVRPRKGAGVSMLLGDAGKAHRAIRGTDFENLDILPAHRSFRKLERALAAVRKPRSRVGKMLARQRREYDLAVLDCPPTLSLTAESVIRAADVVAIPVIPTTLSERTLEMLLEFLEQHGVKKSRRLAFFSLVDKRKTLHRRLVDELPADDRVRFCRTIVPNSTDIERMGVQREPVAAYAPRSPGAEAYAALWSEVRKRLRL